MAACVSCSSVRSRRVLAAILAFAAGQDGGKGEDDAVKTYRYDEMRKNILPLGLAAQGKITPPPAAKTRQLPIVFPPLLCHSHTEASRLVTPFSLTWEAPDEPPRFLTAP